MGRTNYNASLPGFIVDHNSIVRSPGRQVDWANVATLNTLGKKVLKAGTVVGDTLGSGKISPRVVTTNPAVGILETDVTQDDTTNALTGVGVIVGGAIYENLLAAGVPDAATKTELRANGYWHFRTYQDTRT